MKHIGHVEFEDVYRLRGGISMLAGQSSLGVLVWLADGWDVEFTWDREVAARIMEMFERAIEQRELLDGVNVVEYLDPDDGGTNARIEILAMQDAAGLYFEIEIANDRASSMDVRLDTVAKIVELIKLGIAELNAQD